MCECMSVEVQSVDSLEMKLQVVGSTQKGHQELNTELGKQVLLTPSPSSLAPVLIFLKDFLTYIHLVGVCMCPHCCSWRPEEHMGSLELQFVATPVN